MDLMSKEGDVELESQHNLKEVYIELHRLPSNPLKVTRSGPSETVLERRRSRRVPSGTKVQPALSNKGTFESESGWLYY
ncbi:unnamed protein product [Allacma fusca]|uniref:Uncharacterized protein n=1 Tax=Allacma fusca TaxID=39272 RepID=A0A8J2KC37_9HEXA|nr:unnamed protein product [Allacma fusca]